MQPDNDKLIRTDQAVGYVVEMVIFALDRIFPYSYELKVTQGTDTEPWYVKLEPLASEKSKYLPGAVCECQIKPQALTNWILDGGGHTTVDYAAGIIARMVAEMSQMALTKQLGLDILSQAKGVLAASKIGQDMGLSGGAVILGADGKPVNTTKGDA